MDGLRDSRLFSALGISFISRDDLRLFKNLTIDDELRTEYALLDALMQRWTKEQAEAILYHIRGSTQEEIAKTLKISQPVVFQRLRLAGYRAVEAALERFEMVVL